MVAGMYQGLVQAIVRVTIPEAWRRTQWQMQPGFVELIPATAGLDEAFTAMWKASVNWDGKDPVRPFQ